MPSLSTRRSGLLAALAGLAAATLSDLTVFLTISAYASCVYLFRADHVPRDVLAQRVNDFADRAQILGGLLYPSLTFLAGFLGTRRISRGFAWHAGIVGVFSWLGIVGLGFLFASGSELAWFGLGMLPLAFVGASAGAAAGRAVGESNRALAQLSAALRASRSPVEALQHIATVRGLGQEASTALWQSAGDAMRCIARAGSSAPNDADTPDQDVPDAVVLRVRGGYLLRRNSDRLATLWVTIPSPSDEHHVLEVRAKLPRFSLQLRGTTWLRVAQALAVTLQDIAALDRVRQAAIQCERERIGHDMHDTVAQDVLSAIVHMEAARLGGIEDDIARPHVDAALSIAREALSSVRDVVWASRPRPVVGVVSLPEALASLVTDWQRRTAVRAELSCHGNVERLDANVEETLLLVTREALQNVRKHAAANEVAVTLSYMGSAVALDVRDDGCGFDSGALTPNSGRGGFGLVSIQDQVRRIGGNVVVEARRGSGTTLAVLIPLPFASEVRVASRPDPGKREVSQG